MKRRTSTKVRRVVEGRTLTSLGFGLWLAVAVTGCSVETAPGGSTAPKFSTINKEIFEERCTFACHSGGEFAAGGLDMQQDPYGALVEASATAVECKTSTMKRVERGKPDESLLFEKITAKSKGIAPACGEPMPPGADLEPLSDDEVESIRAWIAAGANDD